MTHAQLVPVFLGHINHEPALLCNARDLHAFLKVGRRFATWIVERIAEYGFVEHQDFVLISPIREIKTGRGGDRKTKDYHLTLDTAKELAMVERTDQGRMVRRYFIECERQLREAPQARPGMVAVDAAGLDMLRQDLRALRVTAQDVADCLRPLMGRHDHGEVSLLWTRAQEIALCWRALGVGPLSQPLAAAVPPSTPPQGAPSATARLLVQQYALPKPRPATEPLVINEPLSNIEAMRRKLDVWAASRAEGFVITARQLATEVLGIAADQVTHGDLANVGKVMRSLRWRRVHAGPRGDSYLGYQKPRY